MLRFLISAGLAATLSACGGVLAYDRNDTVHAGPLDDMDLNEMKSSRSIQSKGGFDRITYAIDAGGKLVGTCRTEFGGGTSGDTEFAVFNILGQRRIYADEDDIADALDSAFGGSDYAKLMRVTYLDCYRVGVTGKASEMVIYLQPQHPELGADAPDVAARFDVRGTTLDILDAERFPRGGAPTRVVAGENPLDGNTVEIVNGEIEINGAPILLNGQPVAADGVKHQFE